MSALLLLSVCALAEEAGCDAPDAKGRALTGEDTADYYDTASHYDVLWGKDNIHIGYYPHLGNRNAITLSFAQAAQQMTRRAIELGDVRHDSVVLDLGCGKGIGCREVAELTGATCVGLDLSPENIRRAEAMAKENPHLRLEFVVGSFTDLPASLHGRFTHVLSQESFVHVHRALPAIWAQVRLALAPGGKAVINDYLGTDGEPSEVTRRAVYDRLGFEYLAGHRAWRRSAEEAGLTLKHYEDLDEHAAFGYAQLAEGARAHDFRSADGTPLAENYRLSAEAAGAHQIGLNLALLVVQ